MTETTVKSKQKTVAAKKTKTVLTKEENIREINDIRYLYVLRHGKASKDYDAYEDIERPLEKRGKKDSKLIRKWLKSEGIKPDLILCSPSARTKETLDRIVKAFDNAEVLFLEQLYLASAEEILHILRRLAPSKHSVLLIGHNPGLFDLLELVCDMGRSNDMAVERLGGKFPTASVACLKINGAWANMEERSAFLADFVRPIDIRA